MPAREPRTATIRLDRVEPGMVFYGDRHHRPCFEDGGTVLRSYAVKNTEREQWRITWDGGSLVAAPSREVRVVDESGLLAFKYDVEVYGPFVCASGDQIDPAGDLVGGGRLHLSNVRLSGWDPNAPVFADILIRQNGDMVALLRRVELSRLVSLARQTETTARAKGNEVVFHAWSSGGCGGYHPKDAPCPKPDTAA